MAGNIIPLLQKQIIFTTMDHQTHVKVPLFLEKSYQSLTIEWGYDPQIVPDIQARKWIAEALPRYFPGELPKVETFLPLINLLTISIAQEENYVGCRHHKAPAQVIYLSEKESSEGFLPCSITAGQWEIQLNLHSVRSDVAVTMRVSGEEMA